ncbi:MAG: beta-ketoacyl-ACP synthase, partial [Limnothrix sp. RL_2_0]|nr:beta-ketoacyl-ACP synthase [Limnothrix sp. RL_2_0]
MERVVVTGIGLRCGLGNLVTAWQNLLPGKTAIQLRQPFADLPVIPVAMFDKYPVDLETLRQDLVTDVLQDAGLVDPLPDCGVVVGSSRGFQGKLERLNQDRLAGKLTELEGWLQFLPHHLAIATAQQIGSTGANLVPMGACTTGIWSMCQGFELLQRGTCEQVLVGALESPVTRLSIAGFQKMGALANTCCFPFDQNRQGLVLGEGGAMVMLETLASAQKRRAKIYGEMLGWSFTCDADHVSAPQK